MMYGKDKPMYKKKQKKGNNYQANPNKVSGTGSCSSKGIRSYK